MAKRIWTKRHSPDHVEMLELHDNGVVFWRDEVKEPSDVFELQGDGSVSLHREVRESVAQFFVDVDFIAEKFAETGRTFDASKMPGNFVSYPRNG